MIGRVNQSANNIFSNSASAMSRTRSDYSGSSEEWDKILIGTNALPVGAIINY